jgi:hypothetical protein
LEFFYCRYNRHTFAALPIEIYKAEIYKVEIYKKVSGGAHLSEGDLGLD